MKITTKKYATYAADPAAFRADLIVDVDGVPRRFGDVQDDWQRNDFSALDPALKLAAGQSKVDPDNPVLSRAYLERPRGHSKTTDLAVTCAYALAFATRPLKAYAFAADRDQAALLKDALHSLCRLNPWLSSILDVQKGLVVNFAKGHPGEGSRLTIEASNVGSSYGILPDLIIADELTHWEGDGALWHSLLSSAAKRSTCLLVIISNAGFVDSWQWGVREAARVDESWIFSTLDGPHASWFTKSRLAEQRRMLPEIAFARLWLNRWSTGGGDALTEDAVNAAFRDELEPMPGKRDGFRFVAGVDLGLTRDCSAVAVLAIPADGMSGKIRLAHTKLWRPMLGQKINLMEVERYLLDLDSQFGLEFIGFDSWQAEHLSLAIEADSGRRRRNARRLFGNKPFMREIPPTGPNLRAQASLVIESFTDRRLLLYPQDDLKRDLLRLRVEERSYGYRLVSPRDGDGHGDTFSAFSLALLIANEVAGTRQIVVGGSGNTIDPAEAFVRRQQEYEQEMERLHELGTHDNGQDELVAAMRSLRHPLSS